MKKFNKVTAFSTFVLALGLVSCVNEEVATDEDVSSDVYNEEIGSGVDENATDESIETSHITGDVLVKNVNARKAIACGYDEEYICNDILADGSLSANYFVPVGFLQNPEGGDYRDGIDTYQNYNVEEAKAYWDMAKMELGFETAELELLNYDDENSKKIGEFLKSELEQNLEGLTVTVKMVPYQQKLDLGVEGDFQVNINRWGPDYLDARTFLDMYLSDNGYNESGYNSSVYDDLVKGDYSTEEERYAAFVEAERVLLEEDAPLAPLYQSNKIMLSKPELSGVVAHSYAADFSYQWAELDRENKFLNLLVDAKAPSLDTNMATDAVSFDILNAIGEGLVSLGKEGSNVIPGIAESWDVSEDGLTYTFHLRDDATFVNYMGEVVGNVTAQSFVDSWERLENPDTNAIYGFMVRDTANIDTYTAIDDYTLGVTLTEVTPWFLSLMSFGTFQPIHMESLEKFGDSYGTTFATTISSGPFYLSDWSFNERVVMSKNVHYFDADSVKIDGINQRVIEGVENDTALGMYFNGEIDRVALSGENVVTYKEHDDAEIVNDSRIYYLDFRVKED